MKILNDYAQRKKSNRIYAHFSWYRQFSLNILPYERLPHIFGVCFVFFHFVCSLFLCSCCCGFYALNFRRLHGGNSPDEHLWIWLDFVRAHFQTFNTICISNQNEYVKQYVAKALCFDESLNLLFIWLQQPFICFDIFRFRAMSLSFEIAFVCCWFPFFSLDVILHQAGSYLNNNLCSFVNSHIICKAWLEFFCCSLSCHTFSG